MLTFLKNEIEIERMPNVKKARIYLFLITFIQGNNDNIIFVI